MSDNTYSKDCSKGAEPLQATETARCVSEAGTGHDRQLHKKRNQEMLIHTARIRSGY